MTLKREMVFLGVHLNSVRKKLFVYHDILH
jgi:hypothetical protein